MKKEPTIDKRILKSKKAIKHALVETLTEKTIAKITVKEICDKADVNRKTFYNYYEGVYDVLEKIESDVVSSFEQRIISVDLEECLEKPELFFQFLVDMVNSDLEFYNNLFRIKGTSNFTTQIMMAIYNKVVECTHPLVSINDENYYLIVKFIISGIVIIFHDWFKGNREMPLEELSKTISLFCYSGFSKLNQSYQNK